MDNFDFSFTNWHAISEVDPSNWVDDRRYNEERLRWFLIRFHIRGVMRLDSDSFRIEGRTISIRNLDAVSYNGALIYIKQPITYVIPSDISNDKIYVYISANNTVEVGNTQERTYPRISIYVKETPTEHTQDLMIAGLLQHGEQFREDEKFIPICVWTDSHYRLHVRINFLTNKTVLIVKSLINSPLQENMVLASILAPMQCESTESCLGYFRLWHRILLSLSALIEKRDGQNNRWRDVRAQAIKTIEILDHTNIDNLSGMITCLEAFADMLLVAIQDEPIQVVNEQISKRGCWPFR